MSKSLSTPESRSDPDVSGESDESLVLKVVRRDLSPTHWRTGQAAFAELYNRHAGALLAFLACRTMPADRDDLHQTAWSKAWEKMPQQFQGGNIRAWMFQIVRHLMIDEARRGSMENLAGAAPSEEVDPLAAMVHAERTQALSDCIAGLESQESSVVRKLLQGDAYSEICATLGITSNTAYKTLHRAKSKLRQCLEGK